MRSVILFNDTFTNYCEPDIGLAACDVLAGSGVRARVVRHGCCGRPLISKGMLDAARSLAEANADALSAEESPILFLEPSCLSAVREDAPALLRGDAQQKARRVADRCLLFEEYVERVWRDGSILGWTRGWTPPRLLPGPSTVLLHGHCHQNAMGLVRPARALLSRIPSCSVIDLDAGCCGMAGSFGYGREHYEISRQIGERRLFPAARGMDGRAILVASGTSCRQQVAHFTEVRAVHPAVLLRSLMAPLE